MDSLRRAAWARNPFVYTGLDFADLVPSRHAPPEEAGLYTFKSQRFAAADSLFGIALRKRREPDRATVIHALVTLGAAPPDSR